MKFMEPEEVVTFEVIHRVEKLVAQEFLVSLLSGESRGNSRFEIKRIVASDSKKVRAP